MMVLRGVCVLLCLGLFAVIALEGDTFVSAAQNPFISSRKSQPASSARPLAICPAFLQPLMEKVAALQHTIKQHMVRLAKDIRQNPFGRSFWGFMSLAFVYGVIHALGPGHGKIYACSYFLSQPGTFKRVVLFGNLTMLMHVFSGTLLILFGAFILKTSGAMTLENSRVIFERLSYSLLILVGTFFSIKIVLSLRSGIENDHEYPGGDLKSLVLTAIAVGMVPCPGAAIILLFALTLGILPAGLWAMVCIAAGMALTTSFFALSVVILRKTFLSLAGGSERRVAAVYLTFSLMGALCILLLGVILLIGSF